MDDRAEHYYKEGFDLFQHGHYTESLASCDKAIAINPDYSEVKQNRKIALKKQT